MKSKKTNSAIRDSGEYKTINGAYFDLDIYGG